MQHLDGRCLIFFQAAGEKFKSFTLHVMVVSAGDEYEVSDCCFTALIIMLRRNVLMTTTMNVLLSTSL